MSDFLDVINAFSTPLKLAWVGWIAWGVGQYFWFRYERSTPANRVTSVARPAAKKAAPAKASRPEAPEPPVVGRLITPSHVATEPKPSPAMSAQPEGVTGPPPEPISVPSPMAVPGMVDAPAAAFDPPTAVAAFDPSNAVIEQFGATADNVLDKFVRDFEMQDARPRRRRNPPPDAASYGTEAPPHP
jgi:hypothetical protein